MVNSLLGLSAAFLNLKIGLLYWGYGGGITVPVECRLSAVLNMKRLKQPDVIRGTGLAKATVTALYFDSAKRLDYATLEKLCRFLDCQPGDLLAYVPDDGQSR